MAGTKRPSQRSPSTAASGTRKPSTKRTSNISSADLLNRLRKAKEILGRGSDPIAALQQAGLGTPLIIHGEDQLRVRRYISWIGENLFPSQNGSSGYKIFASELNSSSKLRSFSDNLRTASLFSQVELIVIRDGDALKGVNAKHATEAIKSAASHKFILITGGDAIPQGSLIANLDSEHIVHVSSLSETELKTWIERELRQSSHLGGISADAVDLITQVLSNDLGALSQFINKLALLSNPTESINSNLVSQLLIETPERSSFELLRAIAKNDAMGAAECLDSLLESGSHPLQITAFLSRAYRTLLFKADNPNSVANAELDNAWFWRQLSTNASLLPVDALIRGIEKICTLDRELKSSKLPPELVTGLLLQHLVARQ